MWRKSRGDHEVVLSLTEVESTVLAQLLDDLEDLADLADAAVDKARHTAGRTDEQAAGNPVIDRLFPAGYADAGAASEFRELTRASLQEERRERYGQCRAELPEGGGEIVVEPDSVQRWLVVINDMRLALGTRLGVTAEGFPDDPDESNAFAVADEILAARTVYQWLTAIQDDMVNAVLR